MPFDPASDPDLVDNRAAFHPALDRLLLATPELLPDSFAGAKG